MKITRSYLKQIIKEEIEDIESSPILQMQRKISSLLKSVGITLTGGKVYTSTMTSNIYPCWVTTPGGLMDGEIYHNKQTDEYGLNIKPEKKTRFPVPYSVISAAKEKAQPVLKDAFEMLNQIVALNKKRQAGGI